MVSLSDILKILDRWEAWKRIQQSPERIDALEKRLAALESALNKPPGPACPYCAGTLQLVEERPHPVFGEMGLKEHDFRCIACEKTLTREFDPAKS